jgi:hypothetical protein
MCILSALFIAIDLIYHLKELKFYEYYGFFFIKFLYLLLVLLLNMNIILCHYFSLHFESNVKYLIIMVVFLYNSS